jgi:hypothetical protein
MWRWLIRGLVGGRSVLNTLYTGRRVPPRIPTHLRAAFTMNRQIPTLRWLVNDVTTGSLRWTTRSPGWSYRRVQARKPRYYGTTDVWLYQALDQYPVRGKEVGILGSEWPWYECICSYHGARATTIEYRRIDCRIPGLRVLTPAEYAARPTPFDIVLSISSVEHDGLGRYGDPLDPDGDLRAMSGLRRMLKPEGLLILAVPVGRDALVWNAHRIYGRQRLPLLLQGWRLLASYGFDEQLFDLPLGRWDVQPVFVLQPVPPHPSSNG